MKAEQKPEVQAFRRRLYALARGLTKFEMTILQCLAREGPLNIHRTARKVRRAYSSTRKTTLSLVGKGIIAKAGSQTVEHTRLETQTYDLSLRGVLLVLQRESKPANRRRNASLIRRIIRKYDSLLPLIFGKWEHFDKMGVEKIALIRLRVIADNADRFKRGDPSIPGATMQEKINWFFYLGSFPHTDPFLPEDPLTWVNAWKEEKDIRTFADKAIEQHLERLRKALILFRKYRHFISGEIEPRSTDEIEKKED